MSDSAIDYLKWIRKHGFNPKDEIAVQEMDYYISGMESEQPTPPAATPEIIGIDQAVPGSDKTAYTICLTAEEVGRIEEALLNVADEKLLEEQLDYGRHDADEERLIVEGILDFKRKRREALALLAKLKEGV